MPTHQAQQETFEFDTSEIGGGSAMMFQNYEEYTGGEDFASCDSGVFNAIEECKVSKNSNKETGEEPADGEANTAIKSLDKLLEGSQVTQRGEYW